MSDSPLLTKRLHVSGLTPSITPADLERRLSSFGKVMAMDGFGACDALGDPRKFAFVTMEIGAKELTRCLNVLSGSTWKGAKLHIGEARPDFLERLARLNTQPPRLVQPKRTRFRRYGYPSSTLPPTPLSATAAASTPGWIATPSGRVVRPMRMRPERPLDPTHGELGASTVKAVNGKLRKRVKPPPIRARRRLIDPTKWDSVYLKGVFLDAIPVPIAPLRGGLEPRDTDKQDTTDEEAVDEVDNDGTDDGRESIDEMENTEDGEAGDKEMRGDEANIDSGEKCETVRKDKGRGRGKSAGVRFGYAEVRDRDVEMGEVDVSVSADASEQTANPAPLTNLKALFAPKENVPFSLVDHLDIDLELDSDILGINVSFEAPQESGRPSLQISSTLQEAEIPASKSTTKALSRVSLDPSLPLLFPTPDSLPHPYPPSGRSHMHHRHAPCFLFSSAIRVRGLNPLPPSAAFTRSPQDTSESIRERWERDKASLTREWKKAWREARGSRRARVTGAEIVGITLGP